MKHNQVKKICLLLGSQQFVIHLANGFQFGAQLLIILQPLLYLRLLFGPDTELPGVSSGITDRQHPHAVAFPSPALGTTPAMKDPPVEQRTPHDLRGVRKLPDQLIARLNGFLAFHLDT